MTAAFFNLNKAERFYRICHGIYADFHYVGLQGTWLKRQAKYVIANLTKKLATAAYHREPTRH